MKALENQLKILIFLKVEKIFISVHYKGYKTFILIFISGGISKFKKIIEKENKIDRIVISIMIGSCVAAQISYISIPLFKNILNSISGSSFVYEFPLKTAFFYDETKSPALEFTFLLYCYVIFTAPILSVG